MNSPAVKAGTLLLGGTQLGSGEAVGLGAGEGLAAGVADGKTACGEGLAIPTGLAGGRVAVAGAAARRQANPARTSTIQEISLSGMRFAKEKVK
jgi:hypothetical protein